MICKICGSSNIKSFFVNKENVGLCKCLECSVFFTFPEPSEKQVYDFYNKQNYFKHWFEYKNIKIETDKKRLYEISKFHKTENIKMLDFGCGLGFFLSESQKKNNDCYGIEYSEFAVEYCRNEFGLKIFQFEKIPLDFENVFFDVITLWHSLEHLPDPQKYISEFYRILKPGGLMVIEIPNAYGILTLLRGKKKLPLIEHLFHYTPKSLKILLEKNKFEVLSITPGAPGYTRRGIKIFIKKLLALSGKLVFKISGYNYGDTILAYARKK